MTKEDQANLLKAIGQFVRQQTESLKREIEELRAAQEQFGYRGVWTHGTEYRQGNFVTHDGSLFHANMSTRNRPGKDPVSWTLCVKRGQDGRNAA